MLLFDTIFTVSVTNVTTIMRVCAFPQGAEFDVYLRYCSDVVPGDRCQRAVVALVRQPGVWEDLQHTSYGETFRDAVLYYLPRLLHMPVIHVFTNLKYIEVRTQAVLCYGKGGGDEE